MTVSRVINDSPRVSDATRRRVEAAIAELGYVPNRLARGLIRRKTGALGVIVPDVANPFFTLVVRGVEEVAWRAGYHVILCNTQADLERERGYLEDMVAFQVEGLLIAPVGDRSRPNLRLPIPAQAVTRCRDLVALGDHRDPAVTELDQVLDEQARAADAVALDEVGLETGDRAVDEHERHVVSHRQSQVRP